MNDRLDDLECDVRGLEEREDADRNLLIRSLRRIAEYKGRTDREKELLLDLVEVLEGK